MEKQRVQYIDAMRGFTMLLVVLGHLVNGVSVELYPFNFLYLTRLFRMPLFFTISGFFSYKLYNWNGQEYVSLLLKKSRVQLIPTIFFFGLYLLLFLQSVDPLFTGVKSGFWFTLVLFAFFVFYYTLSFIAQKIGVKSNWASVILIALAILLYVFKSNIKLLVGDMVYNLLSLSNFCTYFQFFVYGVLLKKYKSQVEVMLNNRYFSALLVLFSLGLYFLSDITFKFHLGLRFVFEMRVLEGYFLTLLVIQFFRKYHDSFEKNMLLGRFLQYLGTRTLDVYLLHFFVILALRTKEINAYFAAYPSPIIHFVVLLLLSVVVVTFCLIISNIIRTSDFLKYYLFGRK